MFSSVCYDLMQLTDFFEQRHISRSLICLIMRMNIHVTHQTQLNDTKSCNQYLKKNQAPYTLFELSFECKIILTIVQKKLVNKLEAMFFNLPLDSTKVKDSLAVKVNIPSTFKKL